MKRARVLWITQVYPSGLTGTSVKTRKTLEYLAKSGITVDVCCVHHAIMEQNPIQTPGIHVFYTAGNIISRISLDHLQRVFSKIFSPFPFRVLKMYSRKLDAVVQVLQESHKYEYIFFDGFSTLTYAKKYDAKNIYVDDEDISDLLWKRCVQTPNPLLKAFFILEYWKCRYFEVVKLPLMHQVWAISQNTFDRLSKISKAKSSVMPTVLAEAKNVYSPKSQHLVFTGLLNWLENTDGLRWFLEHHWANVRRAYPKTKLFVIGQLATSELIEYLKGFAGVKYLGYVPDLADIYRQSAVAIAPILINAGIKVKILTYLNYGIPVVALEQATWGMASSNGIITATEENFSEKITHILALPKKRAQLSKSGKRNILKHHSEKVLQPFFKKHTRLIK